jgi:hypothetical protein
MSEIGDFEAAGHDKGEDGAKRESGEFDLSYYAEALRLARRDLEDYGVRTVVTPLGTAVEIPYRRRDGSHVRNRYRHGLDGRDGTNWNGNEEAGTCLYGLDRLPAAGDTVFLVIGEDNCHVTWHYGFEAIGVSAPHDFVPDRHDPELQDYDVVVLLEPDEDGDALIERLSLSRLRDRIKVARLDGFASITAAICKRLTSLRCWTAQRRTLLPSMISSPSAQSSISSDIPSASKSFSKPASGIGSPTMS